MTKPLARIRSLRQLRIPSARDMNKVVLGLIALAVAGALVAGVFAIGALKIFTPSYTIQAVFSDSEGLGKGAPVRIAGIGIGTISSVTPDWQAGQVVISLSINSNVRVGSNTLAAVGTTTFLGGDFIQLTDTTGGSPMKSLPAAQRRIPISRTSLAFTVIDALSEASTEAKSIDTAKIDDVIHQIGTAFAGNLIDIPQLVDGLQTLGNALNGGQAQFNQLLTNGEQIVSTVQSKDAELGQLVTSADQLLTQLTERQQQLQSVLGSGSQAVQQLADLITSKRQQIDTLAAGLHTTLQAVNGQLPNLNVVLNDSGPLVGALASAVGNGYFNLKITGISMFSMANLNKILTDLVGPGPCTSSPGGAPCTGS